MIDTGSRTATLSRRITGFTMIELITTMSIVAILLGIGVPSFRYITNADRASSEINGLLGDLQFARAQAIRSGQAVSVCSTTNGATCGASNSWRTGWLVFSDTGVQGTIDGTDTILKAQKGFTGTDTLVADNAVTVVTFNRDGFSINLPGPITFALHSAPVNATYTRCLSLSIVGAMGTQVAGVATAEAVPCA